MSCIIACHHSLTDTRPCSGGRCPSWLAGSLVDRLTDCLCGRLFPVLPAGIKHFLSKHLARRAELRAIAAVARSTRAFRDRRELLMRRLVLEEQTPIRDIYR